MELHELLRGIADAEPRSVMKEVADKLEQSAREHAAWAAFMQLKVDSVSWAEKSAPGPYVAVGSSGEVRWADTPVDAVLAVVEAAKQEARHDAGSGHRK